MARPLVILHGWSDTSESFDALAGFLSEELGSEVAHVRLGDYLSLVDEVRYDDLASAMQQAWLDQGLPTTKGSVDAIVHSTGGLVIRDWLQRHYAPNKAPIKHLVMLAPANFGSPLAHKGRSFLGRIAKGEGLGLRTGAQVLAGLELGSPYSWELAERDRFGAGGEVFSSKNVMCTVLVGNTGFSGFAALANEAGGDGTVRVSTANLNCVRISTEFKVLNPGEEPRMTHSVEPSRGQAAFGIMDGVNHSVIKLNRPKLSLGRLKRLSKEGLVFKEIVRALRVKPQDFALHCARLEKANLAIAPSKPNRKRKRHGFQNTVIRVRDQYGVGVPDYLLQFHEHDHDRGFVASFFHGEALAHVHPYADDPSYRSFYIDCTRLESAIDRINEHISASLTAYPEIDENTPVGFRTLGEEGEGGVRIPRADLGIFFAPHRTALVSLQLTREQSADVFKLRGPQA